jgi:hypothetical protein
MREFHKRHEHPRRPGRPHGRAWHHGHGAERREPRPSFRRRFATREERIARLETYLGDLRAETQAVEEQIAEMQAMSTR